MTPDEFIQRLHAAGCRTFVHLGTVNVVTRDQKIADDLVKRGGVGQTYTRNPYGARWLDEERIIEWDIRLRAGLEGVTGSGDDGRITLDELLAAERRSR